MGMYDSVMVPCPKCNELVEFQSKSGKCALEEFNVSNVPPVVAGGLNNDYSNQCKRCKAWLEVHVEMTVYAVQVAPPLGKRNA